MDMEPDKTVLGPEAEHQDAKRKRRRLSRAAEAFRNRADTTERQWLGDLRSRSKDPER